MDNTQIGPEVKPDNDSTGNSDTNVQTQTSTVRKRLATARKRYDPVAAIHSLIHIEEGSWFERIIWTIKTLAAFGIAIYLCWGLFTAFFQHKVTTNVKIAARKIIPAPKIFLCSKRYDVYSRTFNDCSFSTKKSYNKTICSALQQGCPPILQSDIVGGDESDITTTKTGVNVSCPSLLLGQCFGLNMGPLKKTLHTNNYLYYGLEVPKYELPLSLYLSHSASISILESYYYTEIRKHGSYSFTMEKKWNFTRLPYPYTKPYCLVNGTSDALKRNVYKTPYSTSNCEGTCYTKHYASKCGVIRNGDRFELRDRSYILSLLKDKTEKEINECLQDVDNDDITELDECISSCPVPCNEISYDIQKQHTLYVDKNNTNIDLMFQIDGHLKEFTVEEQPSHDLETLLGTFGGNLGLMTGLYALSALELVVWFMLYVFDCLCCIF